MSSPPRGSPEITAVAEIAVQFAGFRNIDLFSQGIYQLRVTAQGARSSIPAVPFAFVTVPPPAQESLPSSLINTQHLLPPLIFDDRGEFCSAAFRIKYCDVEVCPHLLPRSSASTHGLRAAASTRTLRFALAGAHARDRSVSGRAHP